MASEYLHTGRATYGVRIGMRVLDSSWIHRCGYDGAQNVRDAEQSVGRKKANREQTEESKQSRWGFRGMTVRDWLELLLVPLLLGVFAAGLTAWFNVPQDARQNKLEEQRAEIERQI